ncbi:hypothetical protein OH77DRAFT_544072 [Trametes cingulata]|nr:hypothetical protein OH77DRAFT_544072 [Trametes cingulata]
MLCRVHLIAEFWATIAYATLLRHAQVISEAQESSRHCSFQDLNLGRSRRFLRTCFTCYIPAAPGRGVLRRICFSGKIPRALRPTECVFTAVSKVLGFVAL